MPYKPRVVIPFGDPAGIGPEVTLKALLDPKIRGLANFTVIGDKTGYKALDKEVPGVDYLYLDILKHKVQFGKEDAKYGRASLAYLAKAHELVKNECADCLVSAPVNKASINMSGVRFSGQTEFLAELSGVKKFLMLLVNPYLKVAVVTRHIPLKMVSPSLNIGKIRETILLAHLALRKYFLVKNPRIGVCGLNPHASDNGVIGDEEARFIKPAIRKCKLNSVFGPLPADSLFSKTNFDCFIAMYHDQGLIPVKLSGLSKVVNMTVGLPFVRTSPGHGTAFDIAGLDIADSDAMKEAIKLAVNSHNNLNARKF